MTSKMKRLFTHSSRQNSQGLSASVVVQSPTPDLDDSTLLDCSYSSSLVAKTPKERLTLLEIAIKLEQNVEVRDRYYHLRKYPQCFVCSEAVDYLVESKIASSREDAVRIGNEVMANVGNFEHVCEEHDFEDGYFFFRFIDPEPVTPLLTTYQQSGINRMDKYGFLIDEKDIPIVVKGVKGATEKINLFQIKADAKKWEGILDDVTANSKKMFNFINPSKVKHNTRRGLPDGMRRKAWMALTGVDLIIKAHPGKYDELVDKATVDYKKLHDHESADNFSISCALERIGVVLETIDRDINRTLPRHYLFQSGTKDKDDDQSSIMMESECESENVDSEDEDEEDKEEEESEDHSIKVEEKMKAFNESMDVLMSRMNCDEISCNEDTTSNDLQSSSHSEESFDIFEEAAEDDGVKTEGGNSKSRKSSAVEALKIAKGKGQESLRRVLRAYCMYDTDVGYCQGMNFITAMFLTLLSEEEAFWLLVVVMNEEPYKLRDMFGEDMAGTHEVLYIAEKLLSQFLPKLAMQLEEEMIHMSMFVTPWLLTVYTSTFPFDLVVRVWDSFLVEGWKVVYRVMLSLLEHASRDLAELKFEQILSYFREFPSTVHGQTIMADSFRIPLKSKHIQNHVIRWRRSKEQTKDGMAPTFTRRKKGGSKTSESGTGRNRESASISSKLSKPMSERSILSYKILTRRSAKTLEIEIENVSQKLVPILGTYKFAIMLHNVLSTEECSELIDRAEKKGFQDAIIINTKTKTRHRDCTRCFLDDVELANEWYDRIVNALKNTPFETKLKNAPWVQRSSGMNPCAIGLSEHFRLLKYKRRQFFQAHTDPPFVRTTSDGNCVSEMTYVSVQIYLNHNFKGGSTTFRSGDRYLEVKPRTGSILLFEHNILHEGQTVIQGKKYLLRTDVMYSTQSTSTTTRTVSGTTTTEQL
ncbi:hypothetical protein ACHAXA_005633 [Cyclostephanos tholiformis]|uniref:Uncharacterized protein n=1 Tax=Cyclostephanos tholiformis TaxID=382380 RepID=A0ABD3RBP6_9STRA